jgi:hypothetical protein
MLQPELVHHIFKLLALLIGQIDFISHGKDTPDAGGVIAHSLAVSHAGVFPLSSEAVSVATSGWARGGLGYHDGGSGQGQNQGEGQ